MDKSTLDKINSFTRRKFTEDELYIFPIELCSNDIDRDMECFSDAALDKMQELFIGTTGIFDHDASAGNQTARIFDTEVVTDSQRMTAYGTPYKYLKAMAYMIRTDSNKDIIAEIDGGIKKEVSVSCSAAKRICSVCGCDKAKDSCEHVKGTEYFGQKCHVILDGITDAYEWSFVAVPAQPNAGVTKKYNKPKEEKSMDFTPINTQAEFDAAVQSRIAAAVADTEKRFEGWMSPEDAGKLNSQLNDATEKNKSYAISMMKMQAASKKGIPLELAERLTGENEEDIRKDAEALASYLAPKGQPAPRFSGDNITGNSKTAAQLSMLSALDS
jgi:hypothetical protein